MSKLQNENFVNMKPLDDAYIRLLDHFIGSELSLSPFQVSRINCPVLKSDNLQYDTLVRWFPGTNDSSTRHVQVLFFFHNFLQNSFQKLFQFFSIFLFTNLQK